MEREAGGIPPVLEHRTGKMPGWKKIHFLTTLDFPDHDQEVGFCDVKILGSLVLDCSPGDEGLVAQFSGLLMVAGMAQLITLHQIINI